MNVKTSKKFLTQYIGCCGWFDTDGWFNIQDELTPYTLASGKGNGPLFTLMGIKKEFILISADHLWIHMFPRKYVKVISPKL